MNKGARPEDNGPTLEHLERSECLRLLATQRLGRICVVVAQRPLLLPVNYVMDDDTIVFRTDEGTKFDAAVHGDVVAFEVDETDHEVRSGWSILVTGVALQITDRREREQAASLPLRPWAPGAKPHFLRIAPATVNGRRILPAPR